MALLGGRHPLGPAASRPATPGDPMKDAPPPGPGSPLGQPLRRREDRRLLTGEGRFLDDVPSPPGCLHAVFLRSPHAHARIGAIDAAGARALPGVAAVLTGRDLGALAAPLRM